VSRYLTGAGVEVRNLTLARDLQAYSASWTTREAIVNFSGLLRPRLFSAYDFDEPLRLPPTLDADALPPGFEDVLEVQVLAYRQKLATVDGQRRSVLEPVWTMVPRDR
jgi:hypothetical protein